jgi:hypothetical protein
MRPNQRRADIPLIAILALCMMIALPWLSRDGIPNSPQVYGQMARIAEMEQSLRGGESYPRWAQHFYFGYGSPVFNYMAPLPHYLGGLHLLLIQNGARFSFISLIVAAIFIAGMGMFSAVRRRWGTLAGYIATLVYLLAPMTLFRASYFEADLGLVMAIALFPCVLWASDRAIEISDGREIAALGICGTLLILSTNLIGPLLLGIVAVWSVWTLAVEHSKPAAWRAVGLGFALAVSMTAFYWLPAYMERHAVDWVEFDPRAYHASLNEAFGLSTVQDGRLFNPQLPGTLGPAVWGLALLGTLICLVEMRYKPNRQLALGAVPFFFIGALLLATALALPSAWLDSTTKFPALSRLDLLSVATACGALLAGMVGWAIENRISRTWIRYIVGMLAVLVVIGFAYPTLKLPAFIPYESTNDMETAMQAELRGITSGSFQGGYLIPADTVEMPAPSFFLIDSYIHDEVMKIERASRLPNSNLAFIAHRPTSDEFQVSLTTPMNFEILTFNFEGWQAEFDDQTLQIASMPDTGLMNIEVPAGTGNLKIALDTTTFQWVGGLISLIGFLLLLVLGILLRKPMPPFNIEPRSQLLPLLLSLLAIGLIAAAREIPSIGTQLNEIERLPFVFEGGIDLVGFQSSQNDERVQVTLFWQAARPNLPDYQVRVRGINTASGEVLASEQHAAPGGWLTSYWPTQKIVQDSYELPIPADAMPGTYTLEVQVVRCQNETEMYGCGEATTLPAYEPTGALRGDAIFLPSPIEVR